MWQAFGKHVAVAFGASAGRAALDRGLEHFFSGSGRASKLPGRKWKTVSGVPIYRDEWGDFVVVVDRDNEDGWYYTDDPRDAVDTAKVMAKGRSAKGRAAQGRRGRRGAPPASTFRQYREVLVDLAKRAKSNPTASRAWKDTVGLVVYRPSGHRKGYTIGATKGAYGYSGGIGPFKSSYGAVMSIWHMEQSGVRGLPNSKGQRNMPSLRDWISVRDYPYPGAAQYTMQHFADFPGGHLAYGKFGGKTTAWMHRDKKDYALVKSRGGYEFSRVTSYPAYGFPYSGSATFRTGSDARKALIAALAASA